jgi:hypothetical protein
MVGIRHGWKQLAEKVAKDGKTIPQGLKPESFCSSYGTAEAVPLQNSAFFRKLWKAVPLQNSRLIRSVLGEHFFYLIEEAARRWRVFDGDGLA